MSLASRNGTSTDLWPGPTLTAVDAPDLSEQKLLSTTMREVDAILNEVLVDLGQVWARTSGLSGPVDVLGEEDLPQQLQQLVFAGGKRIRPAMCHWGWVSAGGPETGADGTDVVTIAAALELLHVFALVHDDVMDESESRRGLPTVHVRSAQLHQLASAAGQDRRFGESMAMLVGDLAHAEADHLVAGLDRPLRELWRHLVVELVSGQRRDITGSAAGRRDLAHAREVARMKSGGYTVQRPVQLGAVAAGASAEALAALTTFGRHLGEAFALRDDILGVWGDPARTGKPAGDDLVAGKPTVIIALADQRLDGADRVLLDLIGSPRLAAEHVSVLQTAITASGVRDEVESMINDELGSALSALETDRLDPAGVAGLTGLAQQIAWRDR